MIVGAGSGTIAPAKTAVAKPVVKPVVKPVIKKPAVAVKPAVAKPVVKSKAWSILNKMAKKSLKQRNLDKILWIIGIIIIIALLLRAFNVI